MRGRTSSTALKNEFGVGKLKGPCIVAAVVLLLFLSMIGQFSPAHAFASGEAASVVIGQSSFTSSSCNSAPTTSTSVCGPIGIAFDSSGNLWVVDSNNQRVLEFKTPLTSGEAASVVIGQSSFTSSTGLACTENPPSSTNLCDPVGIAFDSSGNLWVADSTYCRVLEYAAPFSTGEAASLVIGENDFTTVNCAFSPASATQFEGLNAISFDSSGNLWVTDGFNNGGPFNSRVLEFKAPFSDGEAASLVIGQSDFTGSMCTNSPASSTGLCAPEGTAFDSSGNLWVMDGGNNRALKYTTPFSTGEAASLVLGQSDFTGDTCASGPASATGVCRPRFVAFDSSGNLWLTDGGNSRVLEYTAPFSTGEAASLVIGQSDFTGGACATTSTGLCAPQGIAFDSSGNLWIADTSNNRVLEYSPSSSTTTTTTPTTTTTTTTTTVTSPTTTTQTSSSTSTLQTTTTLTTTSISATSTKTITSSSTATSATTDTTTITTGTCFDPTVTSTITTTITVPSTFTTTTTTTFTTTNTQTQTSTVTLTATATTTTLVPVTTTVTVVSSTTECATTLSSSSSSSTSSSTTTTTTNVAGVPEFPVAGLTSLLLVAAILPLLLVVRKQRQKAAG